MWREEGEVGEDAVALHGRGQCETVVEERQTIGQQCQLREGEGKGVGAKQRGERVHEQEEVREQSPVVHTLERCLLLGHGVEPVLQ